MGLIDGLWNKLLGDPSKPGGNKPHVRAAARDATLGVNRPSGKGKGKGKAGTGKAGTGKGTVPAPKAASAGAGGGDPRAQALAQIKEAQGRVMTPEREKLISDALAVHRAKQKILADLSDEDRRKLMVTAMRALMNEGRDPEK